MSEYIQLDNLDKILNSIASLLIQDIDLAKYLKFNTKDALLQPITNDERYQLINQDGDTTNTRIFFQPFNNQTLSDERTELRIYYAQFAPKNIYLANISVGFDIVVHNNLWQVDGGKQRPVEILHLLLKTLNGVDVKGIGELAFVNRAASLIYYNNYFTGYSFTMSTKQC